MPAGPSPAAAPPAVWEVLGGGGRGGILVRVGCDLSSVQELDRLATGSLVREREAVGERLRYELLAGSGPSSGWVSLRLSGKELLLRVSGERAAQALKQAASKASSSRIAAAGDAWHHVLGVAPSASAEEIRRAFKELALRHHPDKSLAEGAEETFKAVQSAYEQGLQVAEAEGRVGPAGAKELARKQLPKLSGWLATGSADATARIWDLQTSRCVQVLQGHTEYVDSVGFSPDGRLLLTGSFDTTARIWSLATGACQRVLPPDGAQARSDMNLASFAPDGRSILTVASSVVRIWDVESGRCTCTLKGHSSFVLGAAFAPDGRSVASASKDYTARVWDPRTGTCSRILEDSEPVRAVAFAPDGRSAAIGNEGGAAKLWAMGSGRVLHEFRGHSFPVNTVAFLPGGDHVGTGADDCSIRIWDTATGGCARTLATDGGFVNSICFDGSGAYVAVGCTNRTAKVLSVADQPGSNQGVEKTFKGHTMLVRSVAILPAEGVAAPAAPAAARAPGGGGARRAQR